MTSGMLIIEERKKGSMYAKAWELKQDFTEMEEDFIKYQKNKS
jgi:hypothetical protein